MIWYVNSVNNILIFLAIDTLLVVWLPIFVDFPHENVPLLACGTFHRAIMEAKFLEINRHKIRFTNIRVLL